MTSLKDECPVNWRKVMRLTIKNIIAFMIAVLLAYSSQAVARTDEKAGAPALHDFVDDIDYCDKFYKGQPRKYWCYGAAFSRNHDALISQADFLVEELEKIPVGDPEYGWGTVLQTTLTGNAASCQDMTTSEMRRVCTATVAQLNNDPKICLKFGNSKDAVFCAGVFGAIDSGDADQCKELAGAIDGNPAGEEGAIYGSDMCLHSAAKFGDNPSLCKNIQDPGARYMCILDSMMPLPEGYTDTSICDYTRGFHFLTTEDTRDEVSSFLPRQHCLALIANATKSSAEGLQNCEKLDDKLLRPMCLIGVAGAHRNPTYCSGIEIPSLRKVCENAAANVKGIDAELLKQNFAEQMIEIFQRQNFSDEIKQIGTSAFIQKLGQIVTSRQNQIETASILQFLDLTRKGQFITGDARTRCYFDFGDIDKFLALSSAGLKGVVVDSDYLEKIGYLDNFAIYQDAKLLSGDFKSHEDKYNDFMILWSYTTEPGNKTEDDVQLREAILAVALGAGRTNSDTGSEDFDATEYVSNTFFENQIRLLRAEEKALNDVREVFMNKMPKKTSIKKKGELAKAFSPALAGIHASSDNYLKQVETLYKETSLSDNSRKKIDELMKLWGGKADWGGLLKDARSNVALLKDMATEAASGNDNFAETPNFANFNKFFFQTRCIPE